MIEIVFLHLW
jgi:hypothetical protein